MYLQGEHCHHLLNQRKLYLMKPVLYMYAETRQS